MTYDDIQKDLITSTKFLRVLKKNITSGQNRNYISVSNALIRLGDVYRSLGKMLDKQEDNIFRRRLDKVEISTKELQDIVSDSISKPVSYMTVTNRIVGLIDDLNELSELKPKTNDSNKSGQPKNKEAIKSISSLKKLLKDETKFSDMPRGTKKESWEWIADQIGYPENIKNTTPRHKIMQGYLRNNSLKQYNKLKNILEKN